MKNQTSASLPIKKVALYKHGMGYFERYGEVESGKQVEISCSLDEIDDMLKSILVLHEGSSLFAVTYDSSKPTSEKLADFGLDLRKTKNYMELVGQLRGTEVFVVSGENRCKGRVIGTDQTRAKTATGEPTELENYLVVFVEGGELKRIKINEIDSITLEDKKLSREIGQQLDLISLSVSKKDHKSLLVNLEESSGGQVKIAYSIPTPIWKSSYRLVFSTEERLLLQGVAIVDNVQDEDWTDVEMTLVSAHPISFIQPLYEPVKPQRRRMEAQGVSASDPFVAERARSVPGSTGAMMEGASYLADLSSGGDGAWGAAPSPEPMPASARDKISLGNLGAADLEIDARESGELFEYKIEKPVSVPRDSSSLIPVIQTDVEGERVSLFSERRNNEFPYAAVKFTNNTGLTLESGPVTVFEEETYAGECLLDVIKPDDKRILPYALDKSVSVVVSNKYLDKPFFKAQAAGGILYIYSKKESKTDYELENLSDKKKIVYLEHPVRQGWSLSSSTEKPEETTKSFYRFRVELPPKKSSSLTVKTESEAKQQLNLTVMRRVDDYFSWLLSQNFVNKEFLEFLNKVADILGEIEDLSARQTAVTAEIKSCEEDQERARQNVKTLGASGTRFQRSIEESEDRIVELKGVLEKINLQLREKFNQLRTESSQSLESELNQKQS